MKYGIFFVVATIVLTASSSVLAMSGSRVADRVLNEAYNKAMRGSFDGTSDQNVARIIVLSYQNGAQDTLKRTIAEWFKRETQKDPGIVRKKAVNYAVNKWRKQVTYWQQVPEGLRAAFQEQFGILLSPVGAPKSIPRDELRQLKMALVEQKAPYDEFAITRSPEEQKALNEELELAASQNDVSRLKELLKLRADVNYLSPATGMAALHHAAEQNSMDALKVLLAVPGIKVNLLDNIGGRTALRIAAWNGNKDAVKALAEAGAGL